MSRRHLMREDRRSARQALRRKLLGLALDDLAALPVKVQARTLLALYEEVERGTSRVDRARQRNARHAARQTESIIKRIVPEAKTVAQRRQAAWWRLTGEPPACAAGEVWRAREFYDRLLAASESPDGEHWSRNDKAALRVQLWRWGRRANGLDPRFMRYGNVPGRLTAERQWTLALETIIWPAVHDAADNPPNEPNEPDEF